MKKILLCVLVALCVMASVQPVLADQAEDYKSQCESVRYNDVARNPDKYEGRNVTFTGKVWIIFDEKDSLMILGMYQDESEGGCWSAGYMRKQGEGRILKGDHIKVYGVVKGTHLGDPFIVIGYYEILD